MADVKWIKIVTDIFDDEKLLLIETLPEADSIIVIWFKLLCLAGKQNNKGVFMMNDKIAYTEKMLATIFRRKESTVQLALRTFEQFGMIEIVDGVVTIPNWSKHQNFDKIDKNNEYMKNYMREYRAKQKLMITGPLEDSEEEKEDVNINVKVNSKTNGKTNSKVNVSALDKNRIDKNRIDKNNINTMFEEVWSLYPKKQGKSNALKAFEKAVNNGTDVETIKQGIKKYIAYVDSIDWLNYKNGSTWFNQECWNDDYTIQSNSKKSSNGIDWNEWDKKHKSESTTTPEEIQRMIEEGEIF
jgi:predicted phage replisome organizer